MSKIWTSLLVVSLLYSVTAFSQTQNKNDRFLNTSNENQRQTEKNSNRKDDINDLKSDFKYDLNKDKEYLTSLIEEKEKKVVIVFIFLAFGLTVMSFIGYKKLNKIVDNWIKKSANKKFKKKFDNVMDNEIKDFNERVTKETQLLINSEFDKYKKDFTEKLSQLDKDFEDYKKRKMELPDKLPDNQSELSPELKEQIVGFVKSLEEVKQEDNYSAIDWFIKGYNAEDNNDKIKYYTKSITIDPYNASSYNNRGLAFYNSKNYIQALEDFNKSLELDTSFADVYLNRIELLIVLKNYSDAEDMIKNNRPVFKTNQDISMSKYLELVAIVAQGKDVNSCESELKELLKKDFKNNWDFSPIENWLKDVALEEKIKEKIREITNKLKEKSK